MPRASMRRPTKRTKVPQRSGLEARANDMERATSAAKLLMRRILGWVVLCRLVVAQL